VDLERELDRLVAQLADEHPAFPPATVARLVARTVAEFEDTPTAALLPVVRRAVAERLRYAENLPVA